MRLKKSTVNRKALGKNYYDKRKRMQFKEDFKKYRDGNAGKQLHNEFCDAHNRPDLKVELEYMDTSQKVKPDCKLL